MQWEKHYETNIKEIDEQHKGLVDILNQLHNSMLRGNSKIEMGEILEKLANYTVVHFKTEEVLFERHGYPETKLHKAEHKALTDRVLKLVEDHKTGKPIFSSTLLHFLKHWLERHILGSDQKYGSFLNSKGVY